MKAKALLKTTLLLTFLFIGVFSALVLNKIVDLGFCSVMAIEVNPGQSISAAINNANEGDTILVKSGNYCESNILVNKTVKIVGENAETTVIDGEGTAPNIFHVIASNVVIENVTLKNTDTSFFVQGPAVRIYNVTNVTVKNVITRNTYYGVQIRSSNLTKIMYSKFSESFHSGIYLHQGSCNNTLVDNTIENNSYGIYFAESTSQFNKIYHNNLINNTQQIETFGGLNYFDNDYPSGGNYWSDYNGTDLKHGPSQNETGSDGIFDESYSGDNYPLANPLTSFNIFVGGQTFLVQVSTNVTVTACSLNRSEESLILFVNGSLDTLGACRVAIPKALLSCENLTYWNISIPMPTAIAVILSYLPLDDAENTYLFFSYNHTTAEARIEIKGTNVVPEFSWPTMPIILIILTLIILIAQKVRLTNAQKFKGCTQCLQCLRA